MTEIKALHIGDFHYIPHNETCIKNGQAIREAAQKHSVDFIMISGDWFDAPIMASDKGGLNEARKIMRSWLDCCPVIAIEGTPSHDAPGCYGIFEDMGLVVAKPNKVYGLFDNCANVYIKEMNFNTGFNGRPECIIFGIPEVNKNNIQSILKLTAEEANAVAEREYVKYVQNFIAPMRMKYNDIPAVCLAHGNFSDSGRMTTDIIIKSSDIVIHTEDLEQANINYWAFGHIHLPYNFKKIPGTYSGSWGKDFKETGFIPHFNMFTITDLVPDYIEIPYGTPRREKVKLPFRNWEDGVLYRIESDDPNFKIPENIHPDSVVIDAPKKKETQRITQEQAEKITSLWDLFKLIDPEVKQDLKNKVDQITENVKPAAFGKIDIDMTYLKIQGCIFFNEKTVEFDMSNLQAGLNQLAGHMGSGKSGLASFCSPYPVVIGKDKSTVLKTFFSGPESLIQKKFMVNGEEHEHLITIKAAHTQNPKVECYLTINGISKLEKSSFDDMYKKCEELYGSFSDYSITTFYEQPQQSKNNNSGLMTVGKTEARDLVHNIAGIDRDAEKRFALDQQRICESDIHDLEITIKAKTESLDNEEDIKQHISDTDINISVLKKNLQLIEEDGAKEKSNLEHLKIKKELNDKFVQEKENLKSQAAKLAEENNHISSELDDLRNNLVDIDAEEKLLADIDQAKERINELQEDKQKITDFNNDLREKYISEKEKYQQLVNSRKGCESLISTAKDKISMLKQMITQAANPCEKCGHIQASAQKVIDEYEQEIINREEEIKEAEKNMLDLPESPAEPVYKIFDDHELNNLLSVHHIDAAEIRQQINDTIRNQARIEELEKIYDKNTHDIIPLLEKANAIETDNTINELLISVEDTLSKLRKQHSETRERISGLESDLKHYYEKLELLESKKDEIKKANDKIIMATADCEDWKYISKMLSSDKIPALELEIIIEAIDQNANQNIKPFFDGIYSYQTITQDMGKSGIVDRFDIIIHDATTGKEQSLFTKNPGHKTFFSDAYIKALIRKRKEKMNIKYSPVIMDEPDGPIDSENIPVYYQIQNNYFTDEKVIIITHSPDAKHFIQNSVDMEELKS